jgi:hypothetical protein
MNTTYRPGGFFSTMNKLKEARREAKLRKARERYHEDKTDPVYAEAIKERHLRACEKRKAAV